MRCELLAIAVALALVGCEKKADKPAAPPPPAAPTVAADGTRSIPINVNDEGFDPAKITAKPGEKLELVFTRRTKSACGAQVKVADGPVKELAIGEPVTIAITAPPSGQIAFACGMDMMTGVVVVN
ncbi:MAG: cupredoxin domain-containing protein [Deltaproteobacteria bacterium]|nr:cupredoxin domain-containing protein [Kofleriaceae bacterium]